MIERTSDRGTRGGELRIGNRDTLVGEENINLGKRLGTTKYTTIINETYSTSMRTLTCVGAVCRFRSSPHLHLARLNSIWGR